MSREQNDLVELIRFINTLLHIILNNFTCKLAAFINYFCYEFLMSYPISLEARDTFLYVRGIVKIYIFFLYI